MSGEDLSNTSRTNWAAPEVMEDEKMNYSDIPPLTEAYFKQATFRIPAPLARRLVQIDPKFCRSFKLKIENIEV